MLERKIVRTANEDLPVIKEMNAASKMKLEKRMINLSFIGSVLFVVAEGVMAYISHSHAILMDCVFDRFNNDRTVSGAGATVVPAGNGTQTIWIFPGRIVISGNQVQCAFSSYHPAFN